jgi:hypothetical protein
MGRLLPTIEQNVLNALAVLLRFKQGGTRPNNLGLYY